MDNSALRSELTCHWHGRQKAAFLGFGDLTCVACPSMTELLQFRPRYVMLTPEKQTPHPRGFSFAAMPQEGKGAKQ